MSWDIIAKALFVDNGAAAGLAKFNSEIHEVTKAAPGGARGLRTFEAGLQSLAAEAVGLQGPMGKIAEGILRFGGGSTLVLGVAAGIGLIAGAYQLFTADARAAQKAQEDFVKSLASTPQGTALAKRIDVQTAQDKVTELEDLKARVGGAFTDLEEAKLERARRALTTAQNASAKAQGAVEQPGDRAVAAIQQQAKALEVSAAIREQSLAIGRDEATTLRLVAAATAEVTAQTLHLDAAQTAAFVAGSVRLARMQEENRVLEAQRNLLTEIEQIGVGVAAFFAQPFQQDIIAGIKVPTLGELQAGEGTRQAGLTTAELEKQGSQFAFENFDQNFFDGIQAGVTKALETTPREGKVDAGRIAADSIALLGALKQGGAVGILGATGAAASELSGIKSLKGLEPIGIGLSVASGIFSLFDHSAERRQREQMAELTRIRQNTDKRGQPDHISVTVLVNGKEVTGAILQEVMYGIRRAERTNAVPVLPPSGG